MKRLLAAAAALLLCLNILPTAHGIGTSAGSAILMEAESGRVLWWRWSQAIPWRRR